MLRCPHCNAALPQSVHDTPDWAHCPKCGTLFRMLGFPAAFRKPDTGAGAATVLTGRAVLGRMDTALTAQGTPPVQKQLAAGYVQYVSIGEETVRTFLTVFRDAAMLAIASALIFFTVL